MTRFLLEADRVARDPALVLSSEGMAARGGRRIFARGGGPPSTPEERFSEAYRRAVGPIEVGPQRLEEAAFARVHRADVVMVGRALEHGAAQHDRLRSIQPETRVQLLMDVRKAIDSESSELVRLGTLEGRTRKGMEQELERIRSYLSEEVLGWIASTLVKKKYGDGSRLYVEGLGTVGSILPSHGAPSRAILTLASSFMTGNFTLLVVPFCAAATTMMVAQLAHGVLSPKGVEALAAVVPDGPAEMQDILAESPRVQALVFFGRMEAGKEAAAQAAALGKAVVTAWDTADVAIIWDDVDTEGAAREIVRSRFTDSGGVPSSIGRVLVQTDARRRVVSALEGEINSLQVGLPSDPTTDVGPVGNLATLERLCEAVTEAKELGAHLVHGGERINWRSEADPLGMYFQPTLLEECTVGMGIMNEDVLGPVLPVSTVDNESMARALACTPRRPGRVWIWATSRADRDKLVDGLRAPGIVFFGKQPGGRVGAVDLNDSWGALELAERLSYKTWRGPVGQ